MTRTGFSVFTTRTLVLYLSRVSTTDILPLSTDAYSPILVHIIILFAKLFSCFLGVLMTLLWG